MESNLYKILGISRTASPKEIRAAYRSLARRFHPDKNIEVGETELFIGVQNAYEILSDPDKRAEYDKNLPDDPGEKPSVSLIQTYSRNSLITIDEPQLIYVLLDLIPQIHTSIEDSPALNLCIVLDVSTSMKGRFLDMVKTTAIKLIREMSQQDILSIVTFSDRANVLVPADMIHNPPHIETKIQMLDTSGGTEIYQGLKKGYEEVIRYRSDSRINHIILITDGRTYGDEQDCILLAQESSDQGISISGLGIGENWNDDFLDKLTAQSGGNISFISKPEEILNFLYDRFDNLNRRVIQNVTCEFHLEKGVELLYSYRLQPDSAPMETQSPLVLGSILDNSSLKVLFEFMVRGLKDTIGDKNILEGVISIDIPNKHHPRENYKINLSLPTSLDYSTEVTNSKIVDAMSKLTLYRMQEQARKEIADNKPLLAAKRLQHLSTQLFARGETSLAEVVLKEAESLQHNNRITEEGQKRIKYGTRNLLLPEYLEDPL